MFFLSDGADFVFVIKLKTALHSEKFLIVRMPTSVLASLTLEISREKPKYDEFTNFSTCPVSPGSDSIGTANSAGPLSGFCDSSRSRIALCGNAGNWALESSSFKPGVGFAADMGQAL